MEQKGIIDRKRKIGIVTSQIIIAAFLVLNVYVFFTKDAIAAKSLTVVSSAGFLFLLVMSLKTTIKLKN